MGPALEMQAQASSASEDQAEKQRREVNHGHMAVKEKKGKLRILKKPEKKTHKFPPNFFTTAIIH